MKSTTTLTTTPKPWSAIFSWPQMEKELSAASRSKYHADHAVYLTYRAAGSVRIDTTIDYSKNYFVPLNLRATPSTSFSSEEEEEEEAQEICRFFLKGTCSYGDKCRNLHPPAGREEVKEGREKKVCVWFLKGKCQYGDECRNLHERPSGADDKKKKESKKEDGGDEEHREVCEWFLKGKCRFGVKCKKVHPQSGW